MLEKMVATLSDELNKFRERSESVLAYKGQLNAFYKVVQDVDKSSSRSWIGFLALYYYDRFRQPSSSREVFDCEWGSLHPISQNWSQKTYEDVLKYVQSKVVGTPFEEIKGIVNDTTQDASRVLASVVTELSVLSANPAFKGESELVTELEKHEWGVSPAVIVNARRPGPQMTRDSLAVSQGTQVPPHIMLEGDIVSCLSYISGIEKFIDKVSKLLRQIELKIEYGKLPVSVTDAINQIIRICTNFHGVVRQMRQRHDSRTTLKVEDEYDTQDLFNALLRLYFADIRKEEWVPSYAGGATRADFLLKEEKIIIEIKKTRPSLGDREVGEQLIIDIAKYKVHPDCKTLVCFVYDPEARIGNPAGIENDLNKCSSEDMHVITIIEPK